jgi:spermidine/putrescine transport system permease protein
MAQAAGTSDAPRASFRAWLMLSPLLVWLAIFVVAPTAILLVYSFLTHGDAGEVHWHFTLENYAAVLDSTFLKIFIRSLVYALVTTTICAAAGFPVAYFIGRSSRSWRSVLLLLVMIPFLTSFLIRAYAWYLILRREGSLNAALEASRIIPTIFSHRIDILYTQYAVIIALVYTYLPFMILPIFGSVEKLDESLIEAAADLGAGPIRTTWCVILPLVWPGIAGGIMLVFVPSVAMFAVTSMLGGGDTILIGDAIEQQFLTVGNLPMGAALGMTLLALFLLSALLVQRRRT